MRVELPPVTSEPGAAANGPARTRAPVRLSFAGGTSRRFPRAPARGYRTPAEGRPIGSAELDETAPCKAKAACCHYDAAWDARLLP